MASGSAASPPAPFSIFLKVKDRLKKTAFTAKTLHDILQLFQKKYPDVFSRNPIPSATSLFVVDRTLKNEKQLLDISQIESNCIVELKVPFELDTAAASRVNPSHTVFFAGISREKLALVMVGLPARGKSLIARKISNYMNWIGVPTRVFSVASYRRERMGPRPWGDFFDPANQEAMKARLHMAVAALDDMLEWLRDGGGRVAIYDGSNVTQERRRLVLRRCQAEHVQVVFVESIVDEPSLIDHNMRQTFSSSPDYLGEGMTGPPGSQSPPGDLERLREQFRVKEEFFARQSEPFGEQELREGLPLVRVYNLGRRVEVHNVRSYLPCRVVFFLMNLHTFSRPILLARAATADPQHGDFLSRDGEAFSHELAEFVAERYGESEELTIWTSTARRATLTCQYVARKKIRLRQLDELDLGDFEGMSIAEIATRMPDEYAALKAQPLQYRFPRGESFADLIQRLEPLVFEIERIRHPLLIVSHRHVLQCLYTYLTDRPPSQAPFIDIPANAVLELSPLAFRCSETIHELLKNRSIPANTSKET